MRRVTGKPSSSFPMIIGEVTTEKVPFYARHDKILITDNLGLGCMGYLAILSTVLPRGKFFLPHMVGGICAEDFAAIKHEDIVSVSGEGEVLVTWEMSSHQNSLMLTEACDCLCKMCPQPPKKHDPSLYKVALRTLDLLRGKYARNICITGGEPTLISEDFLCVLQRCHKEHPNAQISILTNAKKFASEKFTETVASVTTANDIFCVSLHSDIDAIHDEIVDRKGSYNETQAGIYNLAKYCIGIEIRHVITKLNYKRLSEFAEHMYRYFPFCSHYVFMSMEMCGIANENVEQVYIDPIEYKEQLRKAVLALHKRGLHVSIYNTPLCLCHEDVRVFSRPSISSWKNVWVDACISCAARADCCGFFSTSAIPISRHVAPIA